MYIYTSHERGKGGKRHGNRLSVFQGGTSRAESGNQRDTASAKSITWAACRPRAVATACTVPGRVQRLSLVFFFIFKFMF